jgi:aminoglycoside N3'-acetyltransferase
MGETGELNTEGKDPGLRSHTVDTLSRDLRNLGIEPGDTLFIHSSFKSLGEVGGGASAAVRALENATDPDGLILMPSFNLLENSRLRAQTWDPNTTPSTVGWLTEFFRTMPGTYRSDHYSHSVAARGRDARAFVGGHRDRKGRSSPWDLDPWGKTYGDNSPMVRAYESDAKLVMLGVTYESSTYIHLVEVICRHRRLESDPRASYAWINRTALGAFWDRNGKLSRGRVGDAEGRLFSISTYVDTLVAEVERMPQAYFK